MIIDTKEEASVLWRTKSFVVIVFTLLIVATIFLIPVNDIIKICICGILSAVFLFFYWLQYKMEYTYFYFSNNNKNLVFKFYSLRNLYGKSKTIEMAKISFFKYDIITGFFNKKESLVLYQKTPKGIAKYPPISLTLLNKRQKTDLKRALFATASSNG